MIILPYPPSNNRYFRNFRGRMVTSSEGRAYKEQAAWTCRAAGMRAAHGSVELFLILHPRSNKNGEASKIRLDLDNSIKVAADAMNGVAYLDDNQITRIVAEVGEPMVGGGLSVQVRSIN